MKIGDSISNYYRSQTQASSGAADSLSLTTDGGNQRTQAPTHLVRRLDLLVFAVLGPLGIAGGQAGKRGRCCHGSTEGKQHSRRTHEMVEDVAR